MAKVDTQVEHFKINTGTYEKIVENFSQIPENSLIFTTDKNVPVPQSTDNDKFVKVDENGEFYLGDLHPYTSLERLRSYLFKVSYDTIPDDENIDFSVGGGCSAYVKDGKLYRNLDFYYNEAVSFYIKCKGFKGMSFLNNLTEGNLNDELIGQLPYHIADGKNESGIMVSTHVLFNDWSWQGSGTIPLTKIPYLILSQIKTLTNFDTQMSSILSNVVATPSLVSAEYLLQFLVTDGTTTYAILPPTTSSGAYVVVDITANPKLTNFRWVSNATVVRTNLQTRPTGVERFNLMPCDLKDLRFTLCYESPTRLSEFIGESGTTKDSTDEQLTAIYNTAHTLYETRTRNGETWQTVYSIVYTQNGIETLNVQENFDENFSDDNVPTSGGAVVIATSGTMQTSTLPAYTVPLLTTAQIQNINSLISQGKSVIIDDGNGQYTVTESDNTNNEIRFTYFGLYLGYYIEDSNVIAVYDMIGGGKIYQHTIILRCWMSSDAVLNMPYVMVSSSATPYTTATFKSVVQQFSKGLFLVYTTGIGSDNITKLYYARIYVRDTSMFNEFTEIDFSPSATLNLVRIYKPDVTHLSGVVSDTVIEI